MAAAPWRDADSPTEPIHRITTPHALDVSRWLRPLLAAAALTMFVVLLGFTAKLGLVTRTELSWDQYIASHGRTPAATWIAAGLTASATPEVLGIVAAILIPGAFLLARRGMAALRALCTLFAALGAAIVIKSLVAEPRPPAALWAVPADGGASFPSGHTTVAAAITVALFLGVNATVWRTAVLVVGGWWVLGVACSRIYLANHYPLDVVGAVLLAMAAGAAGTTLVVAVSHRKSLTT